MFIAFDRTSKFAYVELPEKSTRNISTLFLETVIGGNCEIDLSRFVAMDLDRLTAKMRYIGTKYHHKLEIFGTCDSVCVFRNSLN